MNFTIERAALLRVLGHVQSVVERRNTVPVLSNVLIEAKDGKVTISATDLDLLATETVMAEIKVEGSTTVAAHTLHDIVRKMSDGSQIELNAADGKMAVTGGRARFNLQTLPADDFPVIATGELPIQFTLSADDLGTLLGRARYAISTEETRYYLNGIYLHTLNNELLAVSTDGHRLARITHTKPAGVDQIDGVIIPRKCISEILKVIDEIEGDVTVSLSPTKIHFDLGNLIITSKCIDGTFPDYTRVVPTGNSKIVTISAKDLAEAIDRVSTIASEKTRAVKVELEPNKLVLSVTSPDHGRATEEVEAEYDGASMEIGFNARYFLDVLLQNKDEMVELAFDSASAPALIRAKGGKDLGVLMPMRV